MSIDLRKYTAQTTTRLVVGALVLLFVVGGGLIWWIYGPGAALMGFLCMVAALLPVGLVWLLMVGLGWLVKKLNEE